MQNATGDLRAQLPEKFLLGVSAPAVAAAMLGLKAETTLISHDKTGLVPCLPVIPTLSERWSQISVSYRAVAVDKLFSIILLFC
jgi:hypothetical protein